MPSPLDALQALPARGAHFLLCRENKKPYTSAMATGAARTLCRGGACARRRADGPHGATEGLGRADHGDEHPSRGRPSRVVPHTRGEGHWRTAGWRRENRVAGLCACGRASQPRVNRRFDIDALLSVIPRRRSSEDRHDHCRRVRALAPPGNWASPVSGFVRVCPAGGTRNAGPHLSPAPAGGL